MKTKDQLHRITLKKGLKPLPKISVSEWADTYRQLSVGISAEPGRWKTSRVPYAKEIMDSFTMLNIHRVVVKSSAQVSKTEIILNTIGRFAHLDPCTIMLIQPTIELATDVSKSRIAPMIRDTKVLKSLFYELKDTAKTRDSNQTILSKIFPGGRLVLVGANSPAGLASRPIRILLCDEVDRFPQSAATEGDPIDLASKRTTTFWNYVIGMFSTPTIEGESRIDLEYLTGTQEEWQHSCPNCGEYHTLTHTQMITDYEEMKDERGNITVIVKSVKWRCPDCGFAFDEMTMKNTPQKYFAKNPEALQNGIRSFFINGFTSPWLSWSTIMREYYEAKGRPEREQVVFNTRFGISYKVVGAFNDENEFLRRREEYSAELPDGVLLLTAAVDVQDNRLEVEICGWTPDEKCYGISCQKIIGKPSQSVVWSILDEILDKPYHFANGTALKISRTFIDSGGHFTSEVYSYCRKNLYKQRIAIKVQGSPGLSLLHKVTQIKAYGIPLQILGVNEAKQQIFSRLTLTKGAQSFHFPVDSKGISRGYDAIYFKQLIAEHKVMKQKNGIIQAVWEPVTPKARNEALDLRVYNLAAFESLKDRINWSKIAEQLGLTLELPEKNQKKSSKVKKSTNKQRIINNDIW